MADEPVTLSVLTEFHREVFLPDLERVVERALNGFERRQNARFDELIRRFDRLEAAMRLED